MSAFGSLGKIVESGEEKVTPWSEEEWGEIGGWLQKNAPPNVYRYVKNIRDSLGEVQASAASSVTETSRKK